MKLISEGFSLGKEAENYTLSYEKYLDDRLLFVYWDYNKINKIISLHISQEDITKFKEVNKSFEYIRRLYNDLSVYELNLITVNKMLEIAYEINNYNPKCRVKDEKGYKKYLERRAIVG